MSKADCPKPANLMMTMAAFKGEKAGYMTTWRKLLNMTSAEKHALVKGYELIVPYLVKLQEINAASTANYEVCEDGHIKQFFFCPD